MADETKIGTRRSGDRAEILVMVRHPMQSEPTNEGLNAGRFIQEMIYFHNAKVVAVADLGPGAAENPLTVVSITGANPGDLVAASWKDSAGGTGGAQAIVK